MTAALTVRVLGPLEVRRRADTVRIMGSKPRAMLCLLGLHAGRVVGHETLIEALWGDQPPRTAEKALRTYVSTLRRALGDGVVLTRGSGWFLTEVVTDVERFRDAAGRGREAARAGNVTAAIAAFTEALEAWRGPPELPETPRAAAEVTRWVERHQTVVEERVDALLARGDAADLVGELEAAVAAEPLRERRWAQLMLALYRAGRQADALAAYRRAQTMLEQQLGVRPGPQLRRLESAILNHDPTLVPDPTNAPLVGARSRAARSGHGATVGPGFVGREQELERIGRLLDDARRGRGAIALIDGEPGMGKTAFADEVVRQARAGGWRTAWGGCLEGEAAPAYWPWIRVLRDLDEDASQLIGHGADDDSGSRFRLFDEVIEVLRCSSDDGLLIVLDDLHWSDEPSSRLLQVLTAEIGERRILVLGLLRASDVDSGEPATVLTAISRERTCVRFSLRGLTQAELGLLAATALPAAPDPALLRTVGERSEGNPFFALELLRLADQPATAELRLPRSIREVIGRRLASVSAEAHALLCAASVLGRGFTVAQLAMLSERPAAVVLDLLDEAIGRDLVVADNTQSLRFVHALTQEVAYAELSASQRQHLHSRAAEVIGDTDEVDLDALAHHLRRAAPSGSAAPAMEATLRAARSARNHLAYEHAAFHYRQAIDLLPLLDRAGITRAELLLELARCQFRSGSVSAAWASCREAADLGIAAGDAAVMADAATVLRGISNNSVDPVCDEINALCRQTLPLLAGDQVREAKVLAQQAITTYAFASDGSTDLSERALRLAESTGDVDACFMALQARQVQLVHAEYLLQRLANGERAVQLGEETSRDDMLSWGHLWRMDAFWELGRRRQLDRELAAYAVIVGRRKEPLERWRLTMIRACLAEMGGRFADARALADEALLIGRRNGHDGADFVHLILRARLARLTGADTEETCADVRRFVESGPFEAQSWLAWQLAAAGNTDEAARIFRSIEPHAADVPRHAPEWIPAMAGNAELCVRFGGKDTAGKLYDNLLPFADRQVASGAFTGGEGSVARLLGMLAAQLGDFDAAETHFAAALASATTMESPPNEALTRLGIARLRLARRAGDDVRLATEQLEAALHTARTLGMKPLEAEANRLLAEARKGGDSPLSPREVELSGLIADGLSNREIAERLVLSERTVEAHVRHILTKLDFQRRTQIASWATARTRH